MAYTPEVNAGGEEVELSKIEIANNNAIKKMLLLLNGEQDDELNRSARDLKKLWVDGANGKKVQTPAQTIPMSLGLENFTADYLIEDSTDWNGCVALANALCEEGEVPTFTLKSGANVIFEDTITTPKNGVKLVGDKANAGKLIINDNLTWNNAVSIERSNKDVIVVVNENKQLDVVEGKLQPYRIYNYGTIFADSLSTIGTKGYNNLYTSNRIEIQYGAYVYPAASGTVGNNIIAYNVPANETAARIKTLIEGGTGTGKANVNTLIIENGVVLDLTPITGGTTAGDRYNNNTTADDTTYPVLDNVNVELNKGTIKSTAVVNVKDLTLAGEGNTVSNINVLGNLTIEAGTNTIVAESVTGDATIKGGETTITGTTFASDVTVEAGKLTLVDCTIDGTLTNKGTVVLDSESAMKINKLVNNKTLTSNNDINVVDVELTPGSVTTLDDPEIEYYDKTIWYTGSYTFKNMTLNGTVAQYSTTLFLSAIDNANAGDEVILHGNAVLDAPLTIDKPIKIVGGKLSGNQVTVVADGVTFENCEISSDNGQFQVSTSAGDVTFEGCEFTGAQNPYFNPTNGKVVIKNCVFNPHSCCAEIVDNESKFEVIGNVFYKSFTFTAPNKFKNDLSAATKNFCNEVLKNNTFKLENKIAVTNNEINVDNDGKSWFYINELF